MLRVGDRVVIKPDLDVNAYYDDIGQTDDSWNDIEVVESMESYFGCAATIKFIGECDYPVYYLDIDTGKYIWTKGMLIPMSMLTHKIGDIVKIAPNLCANSSYEDSNFHTYVSPYEFGHIKFAGTKARIVDIQDGCYRLDLDGGFLAWTDSMFEKVKRFNNLLSKSNDQTPQKNLSMLKIGDVVRIRSDLIIEERYGDEKYPVPDGVRVDESMRLRFGKEAIIENISSVDVSGVVIPVYRLKGSGFSWSRGMFE